MDDGDDFIKRYEEYWDLYADGQYGSIGMYRCAQALLDIAPYPSDPGPREASLVPFCGERCGADLAQAYACLLEAIGRTLPYLGSEEVRQQLVEAQKRGVLVLTARRPVHLEYGLKKLFGLQRVIVGPVGPASTSDEEGPEHERERAVAAVAARYFRQVVETAAKASSREGTGASSGGSSGDLDDLAVGVSGGYTMLGVVRQIEEAVDDWSAHKELTFFSLSGAADAREFSVSADSIASRLATCGSEHAGGPGLCRPLQLEPIVGPDEEVEGQAGRERGKPSFRDWERDVQRIRFAFTSVGARDLFPQHYCPPFEGPRVSALAKIAQSVAYGCADVAASKRMYDSIREELGIADEPPPAPVAHMSTTAEPGKRCVGDILYRPIDGQGALLQEATITKRIVGLAVDRWKRMAGDSRRRIFAVACGQHKLDAIRAVCSGGWVNGLITDERTAEELVAGRRSPPPRREGRPRVVTLRRRRYSPSPRRGGRGRAARR